MIKMNFTYLLPVYIMGVIFCGTMFAQSPMFIPPILSGNTIELSIGNGNKVFYPGQITQTMGINGDFLAPTLVLDQGQQVTINIKNELTDTTTIHWHGMHVSPQNDGGPHIYILPGATWSPSFQVLDWASTYWYHPHLHHKTNLHVMKGVAGMIIVRDATESALTLPRTYGVDDFPIIVQTRAFDAQNQIEIMTPMDTSIMVNGTIKPYLEVPAQVVRLRMLNGSSERTFEFGLSGNKAFSQIGSDGGLLSSSVSMNRLRMTNGERSELLVDFSGMEGQTIYLRSFGSELPNAIYGASQPGMGMGQSIPGYTQNPLNGADFDVLEIRIQAATANPVTTIPAQLVQHNPWTSTQADTTRTFTFMPANMGPTAIQGPFMINMAHFDMNIINEYIPFNNIEIWELVNQTPISHPFHIHDVSFYILDINGATPPENMRGRKDVVLVPAGMGRVRFITQFETFHDNVYPYMYHCHMLTHEDDGMMGQFVVQSPPVSVSEPMKDGNIGWSVYPNPSTGTCTLYMDKVEVKSKYYVYSTQGTLLHEGSVKSEETEVNLSDLSAGVYLFILENGKERQSRILNIQRP
jgi:FtsP/CotA-like multicopper oxidase with cupredoxin domain